MCQGPRCPPGARPSPVAREAQGPEAGTGKGDPAPPLRGLPGGSHNGAHHTHPPPTTAPAHCPEQTAVWAGCALSPFLEGLGEPGAPATSLKVKTGPLVMCPGTQDGAEG